jgi:hypothetical protein
MNFGEEVTEYSVSPIQTLASCMWPTSRTVTLNLIVSPCLGKAGSIPMDIPRHFLADIPNTTIADSKKTFVKDLTAPRAIIAPS